MDDLISKYNSLATIEEREEFLIQALRILAGSVRNSTSTYKELTSLSSQQTATIDAQTADIKAKDEAIERAKKLISDKKAELAVAEQKAIRKLYKNTQIVRDRIYVIGDTTAKMGTDIICSDKTSVIAELNNIVDSLEIIVNTLTAAGLWAEEDPLPSFSRIAADNSILSETDDSPAGSAVNNPAVEGYETADVMEPASDIAKSGDGVTAYPELQSVESYVPDNCSTDSASSEESGVENTAPIEQSDNEGCNDLPKGQPRSSKSEYDCDETGQFKLV